MLSWLPGFEGFITFEANTVSALELGLIFGVMALGVYLTFRILDFPDLTVDGSFTTGGAVAGILIVHGVNPWVATLLALVAGLAAGTITGLLHTVGKINPLLAGILTQIALYSINLRIMGKANLPMLREVTIFDPMRNLGLLGTWASVLVLAVVAALFTALIVWLLGTNFGLALRATGDNEPMARSQGVATNRMKVIGLALSNGLVAVCGATMAQYQGFADIGMGIGLIVAGLASVILGQALLGRRSVVIAATAVVVGSVVYRAVLQAALSLEIPVINFKFEANDMKLISAVLVILALLLPRWTPIRRMRSRRREKREEQAQAALRAEEEGRLSRAGAH
ncbi:ABC transporter permease [Granulicoccus phenolivorans]|uniref:ABC transporter permease n=1 Tax=Granulicoccus phenolivorans TaxID=266854 RepID=UPI00041C4CDF|nr:ABC transporter permease [Granulicoccus phenolivorans]